MSPATTQKGFALLLVIIMILSISLTIALGLGFLALSSFNTAQAKIKSVQSYYAAEAGIEDAILRLNNGMEILSSNTLSVNDTTVSIDITEPVGSSRTITSQGDTDDHIRKVSVVYVLASQSDEISFYYGSQAGEGGISIGNNANINGNVFSNGSIIGGGNINGTAIVASVGNEINGVDVTEDAFAHSCANADIDGTLHYISGGTITNCDYGDLQTVEGIESKDMPIPDSQITEWKDAAAAGGTINGSYTISDESESLGPVKITGNLLIDSNAVLTITGAVYVQGTITIRNNSIVRVDSSFGSSSGIMISDNKIEVRNNGILQGSGTAGSYLLLLSTRSSTDPSNPAVAVRNNTEAGVFYASNGIIRIYNNVALREATGYQIRLDNNATLTYEAGLADARFSAGGGGSFQIENWQEIE